jgi:cytochrome P450
VRAPTSGEDPAELLGIGVIENPHPFFARLRREHPLSRVGDTGVHLVASWKLIDEALHREADFSANLTGVLVRGADQQPAIFEIGALGGSHVIATADEPDHGVYRLLAQPRLAPAQIARLEAQLRGWAREALAPWLEAGGGDFAPISEWVPARAVAHVLGLPAQDVAHFRKWAMMGGDILAGDVSPSGVGALGAETARMAGYLGAQLRLAMADPARGTSAPLLHALARGVLDGRIAEEQAVGIAIVMFGAGGESTAALIGSAMRLLAQDPDLADALRKAPELIPRFVEETVRLEPPFKFHYRAVRRDCELGGAQLHPGDRLMLLWAAANRDPAVIADAGQLRLDRRHPKQHMGFGRGSHFCIGAHLARLEARVILEEVLAETRRIRLCPDAPPAHTRSIFVRRLERLPLELLDA